MSEINSLADNLNLWHFDDHYLVHSDGSLGQGFKLTGKDISTATIDEINDFNLKLENMLNSLDPNLRVQVYWMNTSDVESTLFKHSSCSVSHHQGYEKIKDARLDYLRGLKDNKNLYCPKLYLFIRSKSFDFKKKGIFKSTNSFIQFSLKDFDDHKDEFSRICEKVMDHLRGVDLDPTVIGSQQWFSLIYSYLNKQRYELLDEPDLKDSLNEFTPSLASQLGMSDILINNESIKVGNYFYKVINLRTLPESTYSSLVQTLTELPHHYTISASFSSLNQTIEKDRLQLKRRMAHSMSVGSKVGDLDSENKLNNLEGILAEVTSGSEKVFSLGFSIVLYDEDERQLQKNVDLTLRALRDLNQCEGVVETLSTFDSFISNWPGACKGVRHKKLKTSNLAHMLPLYEDWRGNKYPVCVVPNRNYIPFSIDPFDINLPNWNGLVLGGSGAGKSFTVCNLMLQFYAQESRPKIVFIDNGRSSENFVNACNGEFIDVSVGSGVCINLFDLPKNQRTPSNLKVKSILAVLEVVLKDENSNQLGKVAKSELEEIICSLYENINGRFPTMSDLREILLKHPNTDLNNYGKILYSWTGDTAFGKLMDGQSNISLEKNVTAIEIKGLDDFAELKDAFMLIITSFVQSEAESDFRPCILICDEAHRLFKTPATKDYILYCYRVFRKYNCSIFCITQNHKDFLNDPEVADAIFPNTTHVFILRQRKIDWDDFQKTFDFTDTEVNCIKSLEIRKREFSEVFYMQDEKRSILRITPDPLSYWICTSDGRDKQKIEEMKEKYPDLNDLEILEKLSKEDHFEAA